MKHFAGQIPAALAKLYVPETDSADFEILAEAATSIPVSETGRLELRTVLRRREAEGSPAPGSTDLLHAAFTAAVAAGRYKERTTTLELEAEFAPILDTCLGQIPPIFVRTNVALNLELPVQGANLP